jgi:hypothetical protein
LDAYDDEYEDTYGTSFNGSASGTAAGSAGAGVGGGAGVSSSASLPLSIHMQPRGGVFAAWGDGGVAVYDPLVSSAPANDAYDDGTEAREDSEGQRAPNPVATLAMASRCVTGCTASLGVASDDEVVRVWNLNLLHARR